MRALLSLRQADHLAHILLEEVPPPRRLAPFTAALAMRTTDEDEAGQPLSTGRMVILHRSGGTAPSESSLSCARKSMLR